MSILVVWHTIGVDLYMKVVKLNAGDKLTTTEKLIMAILDKDLNAFKSTNWQFLRNNKTYFLSKGLIA